MQHARFVSSTTNRCGRILFSSVRVPIHYGNSATTTTTTGTCHIVECVAGRQTFSHDCSSPVCFSHVSVIAKLSQSCCMTGPEGANISIVVSANEIDSVSINKGLLSSFDKENKLLFYGYTRVMRLLLSSRVHLY